ncbi:hypothetical protein WA1_20960 [Scytonema hofmannii PCC 7110]|uniref:Uncharacterized protein n=1 Tax=Scytonema hofmannii PCC 7110 TaxID=128403 RepID=A0A139XCL7_9CYAN|nr:glycosyltransferase [Scytonema hofmannii]KYC42437.1 hypothetical protein WA1_20960 [Scytonema hofmannii PCC 7110]
MKIAVIGAKGLPPKQGGIEHYCAELYPRIVKQGHSVDLFARSYTDCSWRDHYDYKGVQVISVPGLSLRGVDAFITSASGAVAASAKKYDIIHFHALGPSLFTCLPRVAISAKVVVTCQGLDWQHAQWGSISTRSENASRSVKYSDNYLFLEPRDLLVSSTKPKKDIVVETSLHTDNYGNNLGKSELDKYIIRDPVIQYPYLPGSSIKGRLLSILEYLLKKPLFRQSAKTYCYKSDDLEDVCLVDVPGVDSQIPKLEEKLTNFARNCRIEGQIRNGKLAIDNLTNWKDSLEDYGTILSKWLKEKFQTSSSSDVRLPILGTISSGNDNKKIFKIKQSKITIERNDLWLKSVSEIYQICRDASNRSSLHRAVAKHICLI